MQTPKASRTSSVVVPRKKSPMTPQTARQLKIPGANSGSVSSPNTASKASKDRSPKVTERKALKSPVSEKNGLSRVTELEAQLDQLQGDLKKTKDQLTASESWKRLALQEAEAAKKEVLIMSAKLEESERQLMEISASEDDRVEELRKISKDRDRAWQSELEAVQKHHSMDSAALVSAVTEIQKLKVQLEKVYESESIQTKHAESAHAEIRNMKIELTETLSLVEKLKSELTDCRESEARGLELVSETRMQLEVANKTIEKLRSDATKETEVYNMLLLELEQSKGRVKSLEGLVSKLQVELVGNGCIKDPEQQNEENEEIKRVKTELNFAKLEISQLRSALDEAEVRYQEEYIKSTLKIRCAYEQVECIKSESSQKEAKLEAELTRTKANVEELRSQNEGLRESELAAELKKLEFDLKELKDNLTVKETELNTITEQNKMLKREIESKTKSDEPVVVLLEASKAAERAALMKVGYLTEETDKSNRRAARLTEELESAQAANTEMEAELKRLKVQANQWRKAAEAATAMLSNNGKYSDKTIPFDIAIGSPKWENIDDDDDDDPLKKKNNMLRKIGVLWKKGQK
ncbi:interactor of constitutive active ROPs 2, chloroplastic isoform X1 [Gossypium raimondii]|uniref:Interactor of constitutive active ROPs 2, chloroplastic-like n=1 Tax=Gossypium raimondii TaxID=29730 RepID=A0A0D2RCD2_GOSRA|nr:interactor of constitutive active ROPs 2, chloroplastic isoform X1 [Gossypium raimondii]XP_012468333.1 interactor of constitutive active ROPs 2, chloroplastic isoform X1 [Gossypium raimondii]KJB16835.1 hypothetical protein B456_002G250100 [Gossypium raimondii]KJB16836.1 hypothetical protein B456_002G250100 [Gossypium raimondii]